MHIILWKHNICFLWVVPFLSTSKLINILELYYVLEEFSFLDLTQCQSILILFVFMSKLHCLIWHWWHNLLINQYLGSAPTLNYYASSNANCSNADNWPLCMLVITVLCTWRVKQLATSIYLHKQDTPNLPESQQ